MRDALVAEAAQSIARGSKSFALASKLFDKTTRERAWLLYAWCRACDDLADGQDHGGARRVVVDPQATLGTIRFLTDSALAGVATGTPAFDGLAVVAFEVNLPRRFIDDHIAGFALDADDWRPQTTDDLLRYCYHVAGVVGCMMAVIMGVSPDDEETLDRACDLGLAFQLANIARDVAEDAAVGRCYLPRDWLVEAGIAPGDQMQPQHRDRLAALGLRLADMVQSYESSARVGAARLPFRSRWAVLAAAGIYGDIAREVARRGASAWDGRVVTTRAAKTAWIAKAWRLARANRPEAVSRDGLWTRPSHAR